MKLDPYKIKFDHQIFGDTQETLANHDSSSNDGLPGIQNKCFTHLKPVPMLTTFAWLTQQSQVYLEAH